MWTFEATGSAPSLVIIIHMLSWYGKSLYGHFDFSWYFVRSLLFLPHRLKARNQILHMRYYFNLPQTKRNPVLLSLAVKMTSYWCHCTFALCKLLVLRLWLNKMLFTSLTFWCSSIRSVHVAKEDIITSVLGLILFTSSFTDNIFSAVLSGSSEHKLFVPTCKMRWEGWSLISGFT